MSLQKVGKMRLKNQGGFIARIQFNYTNPDGSTGLTDHGTSISLGQEQSVDPGDQGEPPADGATIYMHVSVVAGSDNTASQGFTYDKGNPLTAYYVISGTTLDNDLGFEGVM